MPITAVIGCHWGDEGKGKVIHYLVQNGYDAVARFNGGPNSGHTIYDSQRRKIVLHVIPSGILYPYVRNIIGNGVALDPKLFLEEANSVRQTGSNLSNLYISDMCTVITPYHTAAERTSPKARKIGTTGRGMGSAYSSRTARITPLMAHFFGPRNILTELLEELDAELSVSERLTKLGESPLNASDIAESYSRMLGEFGNNVTDTMHLSNNILKENGRIAAEGAQASLLDRDHGTYPYVTSSNATVAGVPSGLGVPPKEITEVVGVMKAGYITRVGSGAFPTELGKEGDEKTESKLDSQEFDELSHNIRKGNASEREIGQYLRIAGNEYGASTGRPRRTGWPDLVATEYAHMLNRFDWLALTKLDVSDFIPEIPICTYYEENRRLSRRFSPLFLAQYPPFYEKRLSGWMSSTTDAREFDDLHEHAQELVEFWDQIAPAKIISVGPEREQTILRF